MPRYDAFEKRSLGTPDIFDRLTGHWVWKKADEVARMPRFGGDARSRCPL